MTDNDNHKENIDNGQTGADVSTSNTLPAKIKAGLLGLTPATIFKLTLLCSVIALAAGILYHTATDDIHVNVDKVETATVSLSGSSDLGGIGLGEFAAVEYSITNQSTHAAYVFLRIEMNTQNLYELVNLDSGSSSADSPGSIDGWVRLTAAEEPGQLIFAYGSGREMTPVGIGEEVVMSGRLHCLADAEEYSLLSGADMDFDVYGCLVYGSDSSGGSISSYSTAPRVLYQAYMDNGGR